ncbi:unnamed protein product [Boreogadus saida]
MEVVTHTINGQRLDDWKSENSPPERTDEEGGCSNTTSNTTKSYISSAFSGVVCPPESGVSTFQLRTQRQDARSPRLEHQ